MSYDYAPEVDGKTADDHFVSGDTALTIARKQPGSRDAAAWAGIAAAHYAAAQAIITKRKAEGWVGPVENLRWES
jgi:hypothetical protein